MIVKKRKCKHKKTVNKKQDKKIRKLTNKSVIEKVEVFDKEIKRPMFYLEAKEMFFEEMKSDG